MWRMTWRAFSAKALPPDTTAASAGSAAETAAAKLYWRKLNLKPKFGSSLSYFSFKR